MYINIQWIGELKNRIDDNVAKVSQFKPFAWENLPYYISSYECPKCHDMLLYKMRVRGATTLYNGRITQLYNIFTCPICGKFYASIVDTNGFIRLNEYALESKSYLSKDEYAKVLISTLPFANG